MEQALTFLRSQRLVAIASQDDTTPWIANVYYGLNETGQLFFISPETNRHSQNILKHPHVAFSVAWFDPTNHKNRKAIQGLGVCRPAATEAEIQTGVALHNTHFPEFAERITVEWIHTNEWKSRVWVLEPTYLKYWDDELYGEESKEFFLPTTATPSDLPKELRQTLLVQSHPEATSVQLDATIDRSGDVVLEGVDLGELPKRFFGDADYEYWLKVPAKEKDALLLLLLAESFKENGKRLSNDAEFRTWLGEQGISSEFSNHS